MVYDNDEHAALMALPGGIYFDGTYEWEFDGERWEPIHAPSGMPAHPEIGSLRKVVKAYAPIDSTTDLSPASESLADLFENSDASLRRVVFYRALSHIDHLEAGLSIARNTAAAVGFTEVVDPDEATSLRIVATVPPEGFVKIPEIMGAIIGSVPDLGFDVTFAAAYAKDAGE